MGILDRFSSIIKANINDLLDKAENPSKMVDQYLRDLTDDLAEVKEQTAGVMAEETRTKRMVDDNEAEVDKYDGLARDALKAGKEDDARTFLAKKQELEAKGENLQKTYEVAHENASKMRQMHDKLVSDIEILNSRKETIKAKSAVAKTQDTVSKITTGSDKATGAMGAFDRMEEKVDNMLDKSNAMQELNEEPIDDASSLADKYKKGGNTASVDEELEKMKKEMGLTSDSSSKDSSSKDSSSKDSSSKGSSKKD